MRWIKTIALATATCGAADLTFAADDLASGSSLEANPFYSSKAPATPAPPAISSDLPAGPAPTAIQPVVSVTRTGYGMRRLPAPPALAPAMSAATTGSAPRRLPPPLPASEPSVASLAPTLPLQSPAPTGAFSGPSISRPTTKSLASTSPATVAPPKGTNLATIARSHQADVAGDERTGLGELEEYRLDVKDEQLGVVAEQARALVEEGIGLAERGAFFSARSNFVKALRTVAQALDGDSRRPVHAQALDAGLEALDEANDFARPSVGSDVATIAAGHRTPALAESQAATATANEAMRAYYSFAAEALSRCGGSSDTSAEALFQLGKLQTFLTEEDDLGSTAAIPRSTALFHAALAVSPRHARAGNELGFLLAKAGDYAHARAMLQRAVASEPLAEAWHNLAVVHERLGEADLALQARDRFAAIAAAQGGASTALASSAGPRVTWVAPDTLKTPPSETFKSEPTESATTESARTANADRADAGPVR